MSRHSEHRDDDARHEDPFRHDRREHGGMTPRPDDDALARRTEEERAELGLDAFDPDEVPAATDAPLPYDPAADEQSAERRGEIDRELEEGELRPNTPENPYPPSRYDRS